MTNSIFSISVYRHQGLWVFDDERVGLVKEPFVSGADTLIDELAKGAERITIIFSAIGFPGNKLYIDTTKEHAISGTNYECKSMNHKLWLCPALNLYYPVLPDRIYIDYKLEK